MAKHETTVVLKAKDETRRALESAERGMKQTERQADLLTGAMSRIMPALLAGFSVTALAAFSQQLVQQQRELRGMAAASGLAVKQLAAYGNATKTVGINTDQFADIVKDVNDKLGEFVATGGGGFKDFFDVVPESIRPTSDELARMAGPDVLVAVKKAMDDANVSGKEQVFVLESIGNDASKLIPLLEGNGRALEEMAQKAERAVVVLDRLQLDQLEKTSQAVDRAQGQFSQFLANLSASAAGVGETTAGFFEGAFLQFNSTFFEPAEKKLSDLQDEAAELAERLAVKQATGGVAFALIDLEGQLKEVNRQIELLDDTIGPSGEVAKAVKTELNPELKMAARHLERAKSADLAGSLKAAVSQAEAFGKALEFASNEQDKIKRAIEGIDSIQESRSKKPASVLGALTASSEARRELASGNTTRAAQLALQAAEELRRVEEETGENVTNAEAFIKNFEKIAQEALARSEKAQEALKLEITIGNETQTFGFSKEGVKQASDFTTKRVKEAARKVG